MRIAVDMDDVLVEFYGGVVDAIYREFGIIADWDGDPWGEKAVYLSHHHPLWKEHGYSSWWGWLREREWLWANFSAVPGAIGGVKQLRSEGHYLEVVTSKPDWAEHNVWKWLGKWRPSVQRVTIVPSGESKLDHTDAVAIIDDKLATALEFAQKREFSVWFNRAGSELVSPNPNKGLYEAHDWSEVIAAVHDWAGQEVGV